MHCVLWTIRFDNLNKFDASWKLDFSPHVHNKLSYKLCQLASDFLFYFILKKTYKAFEGRLKSADDCSLDSTAVSIWNLFCVCGLSGY